MINLPAGMPLASPYDSTISMVIFNSYVMLDYQRVNWASFSHIFPHFPIQSLDIKGLIQVPKTIKSPSNSPKKIFFHHVLPHHAEQKRNIIELFSIIVLSNWCTNLIHTKQLSPHPDRFFEFAAQETTSISH